jgi:hypothetical protein
LDWSILVQFETVAQGTDDVHHVSLLQTGHETGAEANDLINDLDSETTPIQFRTFENT